VQAFVRAFPSRSTPRALLGDAVMIAPPTSAALERRAGSNLLVVCKQSESALGMLTSAIITAGSTPRCRTIIVDPTPADDALHACVAQAVAAAGIGSVEIIGGNDADRAIAEARDIVQQRGDRGGDPVLLVLCGLHRLRSIRKRDDFSFSLDESETSPDKDLASILREGPAACVWTLAWCDTLTSLERTMERATIREFGIRAVTQMGASDSAALLDSSIASTLGANRAILIDEDTGSVQKFRPMNLPDDTIARRAGASLRS
jgi:DNA segregation ATPase FtsK/SpoIIIE, S-DNA-T family